MTAAMSWQRNPPHRVLDNATVVLTWCLAAPLGPGCLRDPRIARIFVETLQYGETGRRLYYLFAWVVMPNHVHVVLKPYHKLPDIVQWLKSATASRANRLIGSVRTSFWQREYSDHWIRSEEELCSAIWQVEQDPVTAGLVACPEDWQWSSANQDAGVGP